MTRRWIDPAFFTDEKLAKATLAERHLFVAMIANQDDDGRLLGHPGYLRSIAFPYDNFSNEEVKQMRDHLAQVNPNVIIYQNAGDEYIQLRRYKRYQKPRYYRASKFPAPPGWPFEDEPLKNDYKGDVEKNIQYEIANKLRSGQWQPTNEQIIDLEINKRLGNLYADIFATTLKTHILIEIKQYPLQFRDLGQIIDYRTEAEARGYTPIRAFLIGNGLGNLSLKEAVSASVTPLYLDLTPVIGVELTSHHVTPTTQDVKSTTVTERYTEDRVGLGRVGLGKGKDISPLAKAKGARKGLRADPRVTEIFKEMESFLGYPDKVDKNPIPNYAKEGQFLKKMLGRHFTRDEILSCWKAKVQQRRGEFVSMAWVNEDIGNFVRGGEPLPTVKPERNKAVKPEKEGGHYGTGYKPPKPEGASKPGRTIDAEGEAGATD